MIENARYADAAGATVLAEIDGVPTSIPADPSNRHFAALLVAGVDIEPFARTVTPDLVREECERRKAAFLELSDPADVRDVMDAGTREAVGLLEIRLSREWTEAEAARAAELKAARDLLDLFDFVATSLAATLPADFADNRHWPSL